REEAAQRDPVAGGGPVNAVDRSHPTPEQLAAFGLGRLDEAESARIELHLEGCASCRSVVESLPADSFIGAVRSAAATCTHAPAAAPARPGVPPELAGPWGYKVLGLLGVGGMGGVFKAEHQIMERRVALKVLTRTLMTTPATVERFRREVKTAARLSHPNIVT